MEAMRVLADLAKQLGPGSKLPSVRDLCNQLQISQHTLENALRGLEACGLLACKHGKGIFVSSLARNRRIGLVTRWDLLASGQPFPQMLLTALRHEGRRRGLLLTAYSYDPAYDPLEQGPTRLDLDIQNGRVDALIVSGLDAVDEQRIWGLGKPCVFLTQSLQLTPVINMNVETLISEGVRALLKMGRRRIGFAYEVNPEAPTKPNDDVLDGKSTRPVQEVPRQVRWPQGWNVSKARGEDVGETVTNDVISVSAVSAVQTTGPVTLHSMA